MSWRPRDFFQPWPALTLPNLGPISAPSVFLLRLVLHDWKDEDCRKYVALFLGRLGLPNCSHDSCRILTQLRGAAGPDTKLLIGDMLLPNACADEAAFEGADGSAVKFPFVTKDSPLLPNLGIANIHGYLIDIMVRLRLRAIEGIAHTQSV